MKFFKSLQSRVMNEAGEGGDAGGAGGEGGVSASEAFASSSQAVIGDDDNKAFKDLGLDPSKYGFDMDSDNESLDEESQGSDEGKEASQAADEKSFLDLVNSLGLIHSENPFKVESKDELKNLVQMGKDYTQKTQSLSEERKAFETERSGAETELNAAIEEFNTKFQAFDQQMKELEQWTFTLKEMQATDPDLFSELTRIHEQTQNKYSNPILDQRLAAIQKELAETKKGLIQEENKALLDKFEREKGAFSATEQSMKELGITVDWDAVKKEWASSGQDLKKVVGSLYFDSMAKAQASKSKVEQTKAKVTSKSTGGAGQSRTGTKVKAIDPKLKGLAYAQALLDRHSA